jgi:hypothetical protein
MLTHTLCPTGVLLQSLQQRFCRTLFDYSQASGSWKKVLKEELQEIYQDTILLSHEEDVSSNPYYKLITHRSLEEHLVLAKQHHNLVG